MMTVGRRILAGFGVTVLITAVSGVFSYTRVRKVQTLSDQIVNGALPGTYLSGQLQANMRQGNALTLRYLLSEDPEQIKQIQAELRTVADDNTRVLKDVDATMTSDKEKQFLGQLADARTQMGQARTRVLALLGEGKRKEAVAAYDREMWPALQKCTQITDELARFEKKMSDDNGKAITAAVSLTQVGTVASVATTMLLAAGIGLFLGRGISRVLSRVSDALREDSEHVASAAGQVSGSSQTVAQGASEQAASLEETSSSLEEMSSMTKKNAETAQQASTLSADAKTAADKGNTAMQKMSQAINEIQKSATETAKIIKVIDEIAFQTNLLALNAAVEAARAGEAGKGFAVVAEEVRNLAMRSAEAAKNTASMIEESVNNAKNGVAITVEVAKTLEEIMAASTKVNALVGEIAAATHEQTQGIEQVNTAVSQMDKVTQQNAAGAEESAAAAEELTSQAARMKGAVDELVALVHGAVSRENWQPAAMPAHHAPPGQHLAARQTPATAA